MSKLRTIDTTMDEVADMRAYLKLLNENHKEFRIYKRTGGNLEKIGIDDLKFEAEADSFVLMLETSAKHLDKEAVKGDEDRETILNYDIDHIQCEKDWLIRRRPSLPMGFHNDAEYYVLMDTEVFAWCSHRSAIVLLLLQI